jgi:hypothetical protein
MPFPFNLSLNVYVLDVITRYNVTVARRRIPSTWRPRLHSIIWSLSLQCDTSSSIISHLNCLNVIATPSNQLHVMSPVHRKKCIQRIQIFNLWLEQSRKVDKISIAKELIDWFLVLPQLKFTVIYPNANGTVAALQGHYGDTVVAFWQHSHGTLAAFWWHCGSILTTSSKLMLV